MDEIIQNFNITELILLIPFPIIGFLLQKYISIKHLKIILLISLFLLMPSITGYDFILSWYYELCLTIIFSTIFTFFLRRVNKNLYKIIISLIVTVFLFLTVGFHAFVKSFSGSQSIEGVWNKGSYKIEYIRSQGFAGGPLMYYQLSHSPLFGLFSKKISAIYNHPENPIEDCFLEFEREEVKFDRCKNEIKLHL